MPALATRYAHRLGHAPDLLFLAFAVNVIILAMSWTALVGLGGYALLSGALGSDTVAFLAALVAAIGTGSGLAWAVSRFMDLAAEHRHHVVDANLSRRYGVPIRHVADGTSWEVDGTVVRGELVNNGLNREPATLRIFDERVLPDAA